MECECGKEMVKVCDKPEAWYCVLCESTVENVVKVDISTNGVSK